MTKKVKRGNDVFFIHEIAEGLRVNRATVYRWVRSQKLKSVKLGGAFRVSRTDLIRFIHRSGGDKTVLDDFFSPEHEEEINGEASSKKKTTTGKSRTEAEKSATRKPRATAPKQTRARKTTRVKSQPMKKTAIRKTASQERSLREVRQRKQQVNVPRAKIEDQKKHDAALPRGKLKRTQDEVTQRKAV